MYEAFFLLYMKFRLILHEASPLGGQVWHTVLMVGDTNIS